VKINGENCQKVEIIGIEVKCLLKEFLEHLAIAEPIVIIIKINIY
jgi:hypothetical protein